MARILLVEDETVISLAASLTLEALGHRVEIAANGEDGLALANAKPFDLIISDYMMPKRDGAEMLLALREAGNRVPVILATAIAQSRLPESIGGLYQGYLVKPYLRDELIRAVEQILVP